MTRYLCPFLIALSAAGCASGGIAPGQADIKLTEANVAKLRPGAKAAEVRDLIGQPYSIDQFARMEREVWTYKLYGPTEPQDVYVQFDRGGAVREVMMMPPPVVVPD